MSMKARELAKEQVRNYSTDYLNDIIVRGHTSETHEWVECLPDGSIHETEEADNNSRHYLNYPDKEVENIYNISKAGCGCNCDICTMFKHFESLDEEEFLEAYDSEDLQYCQDYTLDEAILDYTSVNDYCSEDVRKEMLDAIDNIPYGYFDDEA